MTIYNANGVELYDAPITSKDIIKCVLMGDYYIELSFNTGAYIDFTVGSYIRYQGRKFEILYTQYPDAHHGGYKYTLRFDAQQGKMKKAKVFWLASANHETTFSNTAKLADFGQLIVANMNRYLGGDNWLWGGVSAYEDDVLKPVSFNGDFCWDALSNIASTFGVEWWTVEDGDEVRLYMGKLEVGTPETFKVGEVITSIPTRRGEDAEYGTRFYVFGSTRNIPEDYDTTEQGGPTNHISQKRLHLPDGIQYIDAIEGLAPEQIVEQVVFFEDVYPKNTETVTAVDVEYKEIVEGEENAVYIMQCDTPFTPDNLITGETLGCKFTSGDLNGREFELIIDTENFDQRFEIKAQTEDAGDTVLVIPNEYLHPKQGDTFVLTGVKLPTERIREAEEELLDVGTAWAMKKSSDTNVYDCPTNPVYCRENDKNYDIGQVVRLVGMQFGNVGRLSRIQSYEKKLYDEYQATYTVGDNTPYSRMGSIEKSIEESAYAERIGIASGVGVYVIRSKYDLTTPTDTNVYSALYTALEYLSKRKGGNIAGPVTFDKSLTTSDFKQGELMGAGAGIYDDGKGNKVIEADKIIVRKEAVFNELVINQTTFQRGTTVFSCGGCRLTAVEDCGTYYRCYYDNKGEHRFAGLQDGDQARCQRYDASYGGIVKYYWRLVVGVGKDYIDLSKTDCDGTGVPAEGDDIVQLGNRGDATRQSAVVISPLNGGVVEVFAGINSFSLSEKNYVGIGVDAATGEAYIYGYGRMYFGDRGEGQYIKYEKGDDGEYHLQINADVTLGGGSTGLSNLSEFQQVQQEVIDAKSDAESAKETASGKTSYYSSTDEDYRLSLSEKWKEEGTESYHVGDTFEDIVNGWLWKWEEEDGVYNWKEIEGTAVERALSDATAAKLALANIANDNIITPSEKGVLRIELDKIKSDNEDIEADTIRYELTTNDVLTYDYLVAYSNYKSALETILNSEQDNVDISKLGLSSLQSTYYTARAEGLKVISAASKGLIDASTEAIARLADDGIISEVEKPALRTELRRLDSEYADFTYKSDLYGFVISSKYTTAFNTYYYAIEDITDATGDVEIDFYDFVYKQRAYYDARTEMLNIIEDATYKKSITDIQYLKNAFGSNASVLDVNGVTVSTFIGVKGTIGATADIVAGLYGGASGKLNDEGFKDAKHGTLMIWAGAENAQDPSTATTRIYEDGTIIAAGGAIVFNPDGSGQLANGRLSWNAYGKMTSRYPIEQEWVRIEVEDDGYVDFTKGGYLLPYFASNDIYRIQPIDVAEMDSFCVKGEQLTRLATGCRFYFDNTVTFYTGVLTDDSLQESLSGTRLFFYPHSPNVVATFTRNNDLNGGWLMTLNCSFDESGFEFI